MAAVGQTEEHGSRWYVDPIDPSRRYESVTTILSMAGESSWMAPWGAKMAAEWIGRNFATYAEALAVLGPEGAARWYRDVFKAERDIKADLGSHQHHILEALLLDAPIPDVPEHLVGVVIDGEQVDHDAISDGLLRFLSDYDVTPVFAEATVVNPVHGYAGTLDLIADLPGIGRALIDCKTGAKIKDEVGLQLAPYRFAREVWLDPFGNRCDVPDVDVCAVLHLRRSYQRGYKLIEVEAGPDQLAQFLTLHRAIRVREAISTLPRTVLRAPGQAELIEDVYGLSRYARALSTAGLETLSDLAAFTPTDLRAIRGIGPKAIDAIADTLATHPTATTTKEAA